MLIRLEKWGLCQNIDVKSEAEKTCKIMKNTRLMLKRFNCEIY